MERAEIALRILESLIIAYPIRQDSTSASELRKLQISSLTHESITAADVFIERLRITELANQKQKEQHGKNR